MKRAIVLVLAFMILLSVPASAVVLGSVTQEGNYFYVLGAGDAKIVGTVPEAITGDEVVPTYAGTFSVNRIVGDAYKDCVNMKTLTIGEHVADISGGSFVGCTSLTTVYYNAYRCTKPGEKDNFAFQNCPALSKVVLGDNVTAVPEYAFAGLTALTTVEWGGATEIGKGAFMDSGLESVVIPEGVTAIKAEAFKNCASLKSVTIPNSVKEIDATAFEGCTALKTVIYNAENAKVSGPLFTAAESVTIGDTVKTIPDRMLEGASKLSTLSLGKVEKIGARAFEGCVSLKSVTIPDSVTQMGHSAFKGCTALAEVKIGAGVKTISNDTFKDTAIKNIVIPETVTRVARGAFAGCKAETLTCSFIGEAAASSNNFIGHIFGAATAGENAQYVPKTLKTVNVTGDVAENAFEGCDSIKVNGGENAETPSDTPSEPTESAPSEESGNQTNASATTPQQDDGPDYVLIAIILIAVVVVIGAVAVILLLKKK